MKNIYLILISALTLVTALSSAAGAEVLIGVPLAGDPATSDYSKLTQASAELAAADLNAKGGVLGQQVRLIFDNDECKGDPAVAAAKRLVDQGVVFVAGHVCSGAAIPASKVYEEAGVLMISPTASNPRLTDEGGDNVFRICGRSDQEGQMAASLLADEGHDAKIAILHDGEAYGQGVAESTKAYLNRMGVQEALFEQYAPGQDDYLDLIAKMQGAGIGVVYIGGYQEEIGLIIRQAKEQGYEPKLVSGSGLISPDFADTAGPAGEGARFTAQRDPRGSEEAAGVMTALRAAGIEEPTIDAVYGYAVFQVWAQAAEAAGSFDLGAVAKVLHDQEFDTVVGKIAFDGKGDVTGSGFDWFVWTKDGPVSEG